MHILNSTGILKFTFFSLQNVIIQKIYQKLILLQYFQIKLNEIYIYIIFYVIAQTIYLYYYNFIRNI